MSMQDINKGSQLGNYQGELSSSVTIKETEKSLLRKKVDKGILYDSKDMKFSIYDEAKPAN